MFNLAIEPLAVAIRCARDLKGIDRGGQTDKPSLYADNLILYLSDPSSSIPKALDIISNFGKISGYKISLTKSLRFPVRLFSSTDVI